MDQTDPAPPRLRLRLTAAWLTLLWERLAAAFWLPLSVAGLAIALALADLLPFLPGWLHALVLGLAALAFFAALVHGLRGFRWPRGADARRRLEHRAPHRPLTAVADRPARAEGTAEDPLAAVLWQAHHRRMAEEARRLHADWPEPTVPQRDPWGLRVAAALALILAGVAAWPAPADRLVRAVSPALAGPDRPPTVDVWVTPPRYTGLAPIYRSTGGEAAETDGGPVPEPRQITAPEGSTLLVLVHGGRGPEIAFGDQEAEPEALADGTHRLETVLVPTTEDDARLTVEDGAMDAASWPLTVTPDRAPRVAFAGPPGEAGRWRLRLPLEAADDFGLTGAALHFRRAGADEETRDLDLTGAGAAEARLSAAPLVDLTAHCWAGLEVDLFVTVRDAKDQQGQTQVRRVTLPQRVFEHPVAARIAALRRDLVANPDSRVVVAPALKELAVAPQDFDHDTVVFMGLSLAAQRLIFGPEAEQDGVIDLLWNLALRVEEGDLAEAERALAEAERALEQALREDAPAAEIKERVNQLRQAMQRYMQAMMQQMPEMSEMGMRMPENALSSQDLEAMLQQLGGLTELGARDAAQAMLDQLQEMLGNLRNARPMPNQAMQQMQQMMRQLGDLTKAQEELLNRTFEENRDAFQGRDARPGRRQDFVPPLPSGFDAVPNVPPPKPGDRAGQSPGDLTEGARLAEEQEALRRRLNELLDQLTQRSGNARAPQSLSQAEQRMLEAAQALAGQAWMPATQAQGAALQALRDGQGQAMQQMMQALGAGMALMPGGGPGMGSDPMGRTGGGLEGKGVKIPTDASASRAREIMMELRRRSNDRGRPSSERDYIRRLLERF